jgi:hypothetical protein
MSVASNAKNLHPKDYAEHLPSQRAGYTLVTFPVTSVANAYLRIELDVKRNVVAPGFFYKQLAGKIAQLLLEFLGAETIENIVFHAVADLNGIAADFTIFDVSLAPHRSVQHHRNFFSAIWTDEVVFHQ